MRISLLVAVLAAGHVWGADSSPEDRRAPTGYISALLYSPTEVDSLRMQCMPTEVSSTSLKEMTCEFRQLLITKKKAPDAAEVAAFKKRARESLSSPGAFKKLLAQCQKSAKYLDEVRSVNVEPHKRASVDRERAALDALCECKTVDCAVEALVEERAVEERNACNVTATRFERRFKQQSPTQWVSVSGPDGICNIVLTLVIEYNAEEDSWSYIQKRTVTSSDAKCQEFESTTRAYSHHRYFRKAVMNCETMETLLP